MDFGGGTLGSRKVNAASTSHVAALVNPASVEVSAFSALTSQQPAIQPTVAPARTGPYSRWEFRRREKTMAVMMLPVGAAQSA